MTQRTLKITLSIVGDGFDINIQNDPSIDVKTLFDEVPPEKHKEAILRMLAARLNQVITQEAENMQNIFDELKGGDSK